MVHLRQTFPVHTVKCSNKDEATVSERNGKSCSSEIIP